MNSEVLMIVTAGVLLVALLYSSVGHAGASGYIAVMSVCNLTPEVIKPTAPPARRRLVRGVRPAD